MTTIINTPGGGNSDNSSGLGLIVGVLVAIGLVALFFIYGWPAIRKNQAGGQPNSTNINVTVPDVTSTPEPKP
ncbi:MAG: hypothetical protein M3P22_02775 [bacterium]|nr:hypothetical protein [bacterium]